MSLVWGAVRAWWAATWMGLRLMVAKLRLMLAKRRLLSRERAARGIVPVKQPNASERPHVPWNGKKIHK